ncbi:MAG: P-loop NTPase [Thermoproteota archaeon]
MIDHRANIIHDRVSNISKIIAATSGKGRVGKSLLASTLVLMLAKKGFKRRFLDLDFTNPFTYLIRGVKDVRPIEDKDIVPPLVHGLKYMPTIYYLETRLLHFEVLMFEIYLIIDTPHGIRSVLLDIILRKGLNS